MNNNCKSCGYTFKASDKVCPYCGSNNPAFKDQSVVNSAVSNVVKSFQGYNQNSNNNQNTNENIQKSEFNVCIFIILIILFWPGAIIYAIIKSGK